MLEAYFQVPETLDQSLPAVADPMFQLAALARTVHNTLIELNSEGFSFSLAEASDFTSYSNNFKGFIEDMSAREDEVLLTGFSEIAATLPDVLPLIEAILSGGYSAIPSILLNGVVSQLFKSRNSAITAREGEVVSDLDTSTLATSLLAIEGELELIEEQIQNLTRGLTIPANGASAEYFVDLFKAFAIATDGLSKLEEVLSNITINITALREFQTLDFGPLPEEE